jgi:hypothetical protein
VEYIVITARRLGGWWVATWSPLNPLYELPQKFTCPSHQGCRAIHSTAS